MNEKNNSNINTKNPDNLSFTKQNKIESNTINFISDQELREKYITNELETNDKMKFYLSIINEDIYNFKSFLNEKKYNIFEEISTNGKCFTPFHYAMHYGKWNIIKFIIEYLYSHNLIEIGFRLKSKDGRCPLLCLLKSNNLNEKDEKKIFTKILENYIIPVNEEVKSELVKRGFKDLINKIIPYFNT